MASLVGHLRARALIECTSAALTPRRRREGGRPDRAMRSEAHCAVRNLSVARRTGITVLWRQVADRSLRLAATITAQSSYPCTHAAGAWMSKSPHSAARHARGRPTYSLSAWGSRVQYQTRLPWPGKPLGSRVGAARWWCGKSQRSRTVRSHLYLPKCISAGRWPIAEKPRGVTRGPRPAQSIKVESAREEREPF